MRRGFCATLLVVGCAILPLRSVCLAQIVFIGGPPLSVPRGPQFASAADFNNDGISDVAISNTIADKISVLLGSTDGSFQSAIERQVGASLRGIATGDFNGDRNQDIAVVDVTLSRVFILAGNGDGTFNPTGNFKVDNKGPVRIAVGNFDNKNGPDLVTANGTANTLTTLYNLGRNSGFAAQPNINVGKVPKAVATADFNSDGLDDIAVVRTGSSGVDDVAILLNNGLGSFQSSVPTNFLVGKGANSLTVADFNDDGVPDIAVLNSTPIAAAAFSISVLINNTVPGPDNKPIGTGFFTVQQGAQLTCPPNIQLIPVICTPRDIKSADFDGDGFNDLVVSVGTAATGTNQTIAGFISAFAGRGDGTFDFGTQVLIGLGPREMAIGDFDGNGSPDVATTEFTGATSRILRSVAPPPKTNGKTCRLGSQCQSGNCVDRTCCGTPSCPAGELCSVIGFEGQCHPKNPMGDPCTDPSQCESQFCVDGACCSTSSCPDGEFCNTGNCGPPSTPGTPCTDGPQCTTGFCVDRTCCTTITCPGGERCDIPGSAGNCTGRSDPGTPCTDDAQCTSGFCTDFVCCFSQTCPTGQICNAQGHAGTCNLAPTRTPTPTATPTPQPTGASCGSGPQCQSTNCVDGICCATASCPTGQRCDITGSTGTCTTRKGIGDQCGKDTDCVTDNCDPNQGKCAAVKTATPTPTQTPRNPGAPCGNSNQCPDGYVCSTDQRVCCTSDSCPSGQSCTVSGSLGDCTNIPTPTRTPTMRIGGGIACNPSNPDCPDGSSCDPVTGVCCDTPDCLAPDRCDIYGFAGSCVPPLPEGEACLFNTDCEDPLICAFDAINNRFECTAPPDPTPTFFPFTPSTPPLGPTIILSRGGGCSVDPGSDAFQVLLFWLLPLALWLRRNRLQQVHVGRNERRRHE